MWKLVEPILLPFLITGAVYYTVEVVGPYADKKKQFETQCEQKGGFIYEERRSAPMCINKDAIIL